METFWKKERPLLNGAKTPLRPINQIYGIIGAVSIRRQSVLEKGKILRKRKHNNEKLIYADKKPANYTLLTILL